MAMRCAPATGVMSGGSSISKTLGARERGLNDRRQLRFRSDLRQYSARRFRHANEKGAGFYLACCKTYSARRNISADDKVNIAFVGVGLQGRQNLKALAHQNVVVICDVHAGYGHVAKSLAKHPDAKRFTDYRKMLDQLDKQIDAVVVCTPEHSHALISLTTAGG